MSRTMPCHILALASCKVSSTKANESAIPSSSYQSGNGFLTGLGIKGALRILSDVHHSIITTTVFARLTLSIPKNHRAFHVVRSIPYNRDPYAESLNETSHAALIHSLLSELGMYSSFLTSVQYSSFTSAQVHCSRQFRPIDRLRTYSSWPGSSENHS